MSTPLPLPGLMSAFRDAYAKRTRLMGINLRNRALVAKENPRGQRHLADDKLLAKRLLAQAAVPTPRTIVSFEGLGEIPTALDVIKREPSFVLKPARGAGGRGIVVVTGQQNDQFLRAGGSLMSTSALRRHMAEIVFGAFSKTLEDQGFFEERIQATPTLAELSPSGLCDVRVLVLKGRPFAAMLRVPTKGSGGKANLHAGGLGLGLRLDSGRVMRAMQRGRILTRHPDTQATLLDWAVPQWDEILTVATQAAQAFPLRYLGVDICVDDTRGPLVLEVNVRPGLEIQNICGRSLIDALEAK